MATQPPPERPSSGTPEPEPMEGSPKSELRPVKSLPPGWKREVVVRKNGLSAGKTDVYYYSPCGKKFRSKPQIARFLGDNHDLSCFDFSRGAYGEVTQRRRARDRQIKRMETVKPTPLVRPLSNNPLRPSGPIRRTCGVIKLPVTWVAPPNDDQARNNLTLSAPGDPKTQSAIHLIVQSLWEKRLFGVKPYDHVTGDEIAAADQNNGVVEIKPITPIIKPHSPRTNSPVQALAHSPTTGNSTLPMKSPPSIIPSVLRQPHPPSSTPTSALLPTLLQVHQQIPQTKLHDSNSDCPASISVIQQTGQPVVVSQHLSSNSAAYSQRHSADQLQFTPASLSNGLSSNVPMVTERELRLQEERVRLLRQQLLAAATQRPS